MLTQNLLLITVVFGLQSQCVEAWKKKKAWLYADEACDPTSKYIEIKDMYALGTCDTSAPSMKALWVESNSNKDEHCIVLSTAINCLGGETVQVPFDRRSNLCWDLPKPSNPDATWRSSMFVKLIDENCNHGSKEIKQSPCQHPFDKDNVVTPRYCEKPKAEAPASEDNSNDSKDDKDDKEEGVTYITISGPPPEPSDKRRWLGNEHTKTSQSLTTSPGLSPRETFQTANSGSMKREEGRGGPLRF